MAWAFHTAPDNLIHTYPVEECHSISHVFQGLTCWCSPQPDLMETRVVIHKSYTQWLKYTEGLDPHSRSH